MFDVCRDGTWLAIGRMKPLRQVHATYDPLLTITVHPLNFSDSGLLDSAGGGRGGHRGHVLAADAAADRREADRRRAAQPPRREADGGGGGGGVGGRERGRAVGHSGKVSSLESCLEKFCPRLRGFLDCPWRL